MITARRVLTEKRGLIVPILVALLVNVGLYLLIVYPLATGRAKPAGKEMQSWEEALANRAKVAKAMTASAGGGSKSIGTAGGVFKIDGEEVGTVLKVIMLDSIFENSFYEGKFDPDNPSNPICFALGRNQKELVPHEESTDIQADNCKDCPHNKFGTSDVGRGKETKNIVRMMVISADEDQGDLEDIPGAEAYMLKVPVTSVKHWKAYTQGIIGIRNSDPIRVITELTLVRHPKHQFEMKFKSIGDVDDEYMNQLLEKAEGVEPELFQPYTPFEDDGDSEPVGKGAAKAMARKPTAKPQRKPAKAARGRAR